MPDPTILYQQTMTVTLSQTALDITCTIEGTADDNDAAWSVTWTDRTRGRAFSKALSLARAQMRAEVDAE